MLKRKIWLKILLAALVCATGCDRSNQSENIDENEVNKRDVIDLEGNNSSKIWNLIRYVLDQEPNAAMLAMYGQEVDSGTKSIMDVAIALQESPRGQQADTDVGLLINLMKILQRDSTLLPNSKTQIGQMYANAWIDPGENTQSRAAWLAVVSESQKMIAPRGIWNKEPSIVSIVERLQRVFIVMSAKSSQKPPYTSEVVKNFEASASYQQVIDWYNTFWHIDSPKRESAKLYWGSPQNFLASWRNQSSFGKAWDLSAFGSDPDIQLNSLIVYLTMGDNPEARDTMVDWVVKPETMLSLPSPYIPRSPGLPHGKLIGVDHDVMNLPAPVPLDNYFSATGFSEEAKAAVQAQIRDYIQIDPQGWSNIRALVESNGPIILTNVTKANMGSGAGFQPSDNPILDIDFSQVGNLAYYSTANTWQPFSLGEILFHELTHLSFFKMMGIVSYNSYATHENVDAIMAEEQLTTDRTDNYYRAYFDLDFRGNYMHTYSEQGALADNVDINSAFDIDEYKSSILTQPALDLGGIVNHNLPGITYYFGGGSSLTIQGIQGPLGMARSRSNIQSTIKTR